MAVLSSTAAAHDTFTDSGSPNTYLAPVSVAVMGAPKLNGHLLGTLAMMARNNNSSQSQRHLG